jgi:6-phosphogluconolactonase
VAPTGSYVMVVIGDAGDIVFPFTTSNGTLGSSYVISTANAGAGGADYAVVMDSSNNAYIARTGGTPNTVGVAVYQLGSTSATQVSGSPFVTQAVPKSLVLSSSYSYLYTGNELDTSLSSSSGTSSGFSQSSGTLMSLGAVVAAPFDVYSMGRDNSGKYILAAGYNTAGNGVIMYSIGSNGTLSATSNEPTGAAQLNAQGLPAYPSVMALTH